MARKPRIEYPGGIYHVIQRANNREFFFEDNAMKELLLDLITDYREKLGFELFGYVIMSNHYHLIIRQTEISLHKVMHHILSVFSRRYNLVNHRSGHVFESRYKAIPVMDDKYILSLLRYIHKNPVEANICAKVSDYAWSSDHIYRKNEKENGLVDINYILDLISEDRGMSLKSYSEFMDDNVKEDIAAFEAVDFIGEKELQILDDYLKIERKSLDQILLKTVQDIELFEEIKSGSRRRHLTEYKKEFISVAIREGYSTEKIGDFISVSRSAVSRMMYRN